MDYNFKKCLELILTHEGGFVNHPKDPGGATNKGITLKTYNQFLGRKAEVEELKNISDTHVETIYKKEYWNKISGDQLPCGIDLALFDWAVNSGFKRPAKVFQEAIGASPDGYIGPKTLKQLGDQETFFDIILDICKQREKFYTTLSTFDTFGKGWLRRTEETRERSIELMEEDLYEKELDEDT
jgi:lysozyme family protein